jgi:hypothetical protein
VSINLLLGLAAIAYGLYTAYVRATSPGKFAKLDSMKRQWGEGVGTAVHVVGYTVAPILVGLALVVSALMSRQG